MLKRAAITALSVIPGWKGWYELRFWKRRQKREGEFFNHHYEQFYTEYFNLSREFYKGKRLLDIGCGPRGTLEWADMAEERIGLDPLADRYTKLHKTPHKMRYINSGSENIPFPDGHFDVVFSFNSLDHVDNLESTISEIKRVLAPGGFFLLLTELNHKPTPCEPQQISWDIVELFRPEFELLEEHHYERNGEYEGMYNSILKGDTYNHADQTERYGVLSAKFMKRVTVASKDDRKETVPFPQTAEELLEHQLNYGPAC